MDNFKIYVDYISNIVEGIGVATIFFGAVYSLTMFFIAVIKKKSNTYVKLRQSLGKSILLGLEILIAADIMATIVTEPTMRSVTILGIIVLIRTFLSLSLQVEMDGRFPWQKETPVK
ncbi:MAG: DUF1622 domain-containing protein [Bacteroidota bacterium]